MPNKENSNNPNRRSFLKGVGALTAGIYTSPFSVAAGPFLKGEAVHHGIPENKKLNPTWVDSLSERGKPSTYLKSKNELRFIGMPVGGIFSGTLYLGGDGRLWLWDIFNRNQNGIDPKEVIWEPLGRKARSQDGSAYLEPPPSSAKQGIEQGFAVKINCNDKEYIRQLHEPDWEEIKFTGQYPMATIEYIDSQLPFSIKMEAFSPFIPLNADDSGLPATIFSITIHNHSQKNMDASIVGWLQNTSLIHSQKEASFQRQNMALQDDNLSSVLCTLKPDEADDKNDIRQLPDFGTMCIALLNNKGTLHTDFDTTDLTNFNFKENTDSVKKDKQKLLTAGISQQIKIMPGKDHTTNFTVSWHFPNTKLPVRDTETGNYYAKKFKDAHAVAGYVSAHFQRLTNDTKLWRDTWYDSTLPYWFLDRTFSNTCALATTTAHRFGSGRFWAWEGIGCCEGTCIHVWQYAQAMARIFPEIERDTRERVDLGLAFNPETGQIGYRGEGTGEAIDGQAGTILRIYREHQMSKDNNFLKRNWPHIKKAIEFILNHDSNKDGIIDGAQPNTLDAAWYGEISWISSLCIAAWRAGEEMAKEMNDHEFAERCHDRYLAGRKNIDEKLFNGEYYIQLAGKKGRKHLGSYNTCFIDQVFGQSYAYQVGLGRILDREKVLTALHSLWKYNFMPDVGPYIAHHKGGRPYALSGEGGLLMDTNPHHDPEPYGADITWQAGYFNECMSGFEYQVASHLMAEGMVQESLTLTRNIHDRYHPTKRNPFNEIECSDHYARAMASYGVFISACGFTYHGPKGFIGFAPKLSSENFKAPFIVAQGWGSYSQRKNKNSFFAQVEMKYGKISLNKVNVELNETHKIKKVIVTLDNRNIPCTFDQKGINCDIILTSPIEIVADHTLSITI